MSRKLSHDDAAREMEGAGLTPLEPYPGNKAKWLCRCATCGQEVRPSLASVRHNGGGCRPCGLRKSAASRSTSQDLATQFMLDAGVRPLEPYFGSNTPWLCQCLTCNRQVRPRLGNVKNGHAACAYCASKKIHPEDAMALMLENNLKPLEEYPGANRAWMCKCLTCGKTVSPAYTTVKAGGGCKYCGYLTSAAKQMLSEADAVAFLQTQGLVPLVPYPGAGRPWLSKCLNCGYEVSPTYGSIRMGSGCAVCGKRQVVPELAVSVMLEANLKPNVDYPGAKVPWDCTCLICNHRVAPKYTDIQSGYGGCKYCGGRFVDPEAAVQLMKLKRLLPQEPYSKSGTPWPCICMTCHRSVTPTYNSVQQGSGGCPYCARIKVDPEQAREFMLSVGVIPLVPYPGSRLGWKSTCGTCGLEIFPLYSNVRHNSANPCLYCAGKKVDAESAFRLMVNAGVTPLEPYGRADKPWRCSCNKCGRQVSPTYSAVRSGQGGCRYCADKGLDYTAPAFLYLMKHEDFGAMKIGIGNLKTKSNRITEHQKLGWTLLKRVDFGVGDVAYRVEQDVLLWIREDLGLKPCLSSKEMPQRGWTETFDSESISAEDVWLRLRTVIRDLDQD